MSIEVMKLGKIIYDILCSDEQPPEGQHWEGFVARKISAAIEQAEVEQIMLEVWQDVPGAVNFGIKAEKQEPLWIRNEEGKLELHAPPQREWQGLTDEEIKEIIGPWGDTPIKGYTRKLFDQIEAKLREKNA
jgi:hypothetical protein